MAGVSLATITAEVTADTSDFDSKMDSAGQKIDDLGTKASSSSANFAGASAAMAAGATGIAAGFVSAIGTASDFEAALSGIASVGGADAVAAMDEIRAKALELGAETSFSASEAAAAMEELVKAGVPVADVLAGGADAALNLAAATGVATDAAAGYIAQGLNVYNETLSESYGTVAERAEHVANVIAQSANASATDVGQLGEAFSAVGPVAAMFGLTIDDTATALAILAQNGLSGSDAGTSLKSMFLSLTHASKPTKEALADIGMTLDDFYDSAGNFIGIEASFDKLRAGMEAAGYTSEQVNAALTQIFGSDAVRAAGIFFDTQEAGWDGMRTGMINAGTVQEQAAIRLDNLQGALEALSGSVETVAIVFGSALIPAIRPVVEITTGLVNIFLQLPGPLQTMIAVIVAGAGAFLGIGSAIAFVIGPMGALLAATAPIAAAIAAIALPLALVAAAFVALYVAYQTNFLGFADGVNAVAGAVGTTFAAIADTIDKLVNNFQVLRGAGLEPVAAAFATLSGVFPQFTGTLEVARALVETFISTLQGIGTGLQDAMTALQNGDIGGVLQGLLDVALAVLTGFTASAQILWDGLWQGFAAIDWSGISAALQTGLQSLSDALGTWLTEQSTKLQTGMQAAWDAVSAAVGPAWATIQGALTAAWSGIVTALTGVLETIKSNVLNAWTIVASTIAVQMQTATQTVTDTWNGIVTTLTGILETIKATVATAWEAVSTTVTTALDAINTATSTAWTTIQSTIQTAQDTITTLISTAWETIQTTVTTAMETLNSTISTTMETIKTTVTTAAEDIKTGFVTSITTMKDEAITALGGLKDGIVALFADAATWLVQAGADIVGGLVQGILSQAGAISSAIQSIIPTDIGIDIGGISISNPLTNPFDSGGGGGGGKGGSSGSGQRGGGGVSSLSQRAGGGPVWGGRMYLVGEDGPELFVPGSSGTIIPNGGSAPAFAGGDGMTSQPPIYIQNVNLRDERQIGRWARDNQRAYRVMSGRGV